VKIEENVKDNPYKFQYIKDLLTKIELLDRSKDKDSNDEKPKDHNYEKSQVENNKNRSAFKEFFKNLNKLLDLIKELENLGKNIPDEIRQNIILSESDKENKIKNLKENIKKVEKMFESWNKKLLEFNNKSEDGYELHSLYGKNIFYLDSTNLRHYLSYFMTHREIEKNSIEESSHLYDYDSSEQKVDKLIQNHKDLKNNHSNYCNKNPIINIYEYEEWENEYEIVLRLLKPILECENEDTLNIESHIFFRRNQILLCSNNTTKDEIESN
jgi:hypothetical protein